MEYIYKNYEIETEKVFDDKKIITISDLHLNESITKYELDKLIIKINDLMPQYIFILGDICTYHHLKNLEFKRKLLYFLKVIKSISKTYLVLGNNDYLINEQQKNLFTNINALLEFYDKTNVKVLNNSIERDENFNIIGFNKSPFNYPKELNDIRELKKEINRLFEKVKYSLDKNKFSIFLTHSHLDLLKLESELLNSMDLILAGHTHNGLVPNFLESIYDKNKGIITARKWFQDNARGMIKNGHQAIIVNGGITKISDSHSKVLKHLTKTFYPGEIDFINIKKRNSL